MIEMAKGKALLPILLLSLLGQGCEGEETSLQIRFLADPTLNTEQQILAMVDTLDLILDAPGGFVGVAATGQSFGVLDAWDVDNDKVAELMLRRSLGGAGELPLFRLLPGSNMDRGFKITARGWRGKEIAAIGGVASSRFEAGAHKDLDVPFNLRAAFRPPRVVIALPHDGQTVPSALSQVYVEFSKRVQVQENQLRLVYESSGHDISVPGAWQMEQNTVRELGMSEVRSVATLTVSGSCSLNPGTFRIEASTQITDETGAHLDQDAASTGDDAFVSRFTIPGQPTGQPCGSSPETCREDKDCLAGGTTSTGQWFTCLIEPGQIEGKCVPATTDCSDLKCGQGYVCTDINGTAECVQDCRAFGCDPSTFCDQQTGLCQDWCTDPNTCTQPDDCQQKCADICTQDQYACEDCLKQCNV